MGMGFSSSAFNFCSSLGFSFYLMGTGFHPLLLLFFPVWVFLFFFLFL